MHNLPPEIRAMNISRNLSDYDFNQLMRADIRYVSSELVNLKDVHFRVYQIGNAIICPNKQMKKVFSQIWNLKVWIQDEPRLFLPLDKITVFDVYTKQSPHNKALYEDIDIKLNYYNHPSPEANATTGDDFLKNMDFYEEQTDLNILEFMNYAFSFQPWADFQIYTFDELFLITTWEFVLELFSLLDDAIIYEESKPSEIKGFLLTNLFQDKFTYDGGKEPHIFYETYFKDGILNKPYIYIHNFGNNEVKSSGQYHNNKLHGRIISYDKVKNINMYRGEADFENGVKLFIHEIMAVNVHQGKLIEYEEKEIIYKPDGIEEERVSDYENGQMKGAFLYIIDRIHNVLLERRTYDESDKLLYIEYFDPHRKVDYTVDPPIETIIPSLDFDIIGGFPDWN